MKNSKLTPNQIKLKKVLKPIVEGILNEAQSTNPAFDQQMTKLGIPITWNQLLQDADGLLEKYSDLLFDSNLDSQQRRKVSMFLGKNLSQIVKDGFQ